MDVCSLLSSQPPLFSRRGIDCIAHTIHNKNLFILRGRSSSLYCNLDSLLATANFGSTSSPSESVWKEFPVPSNSHHLHSLGNHVIAAGNIDPRELGPRMSMHLCGTAQAQLSEMINVTPKVCAYSPATRTWVQVGDIPYSHQHCVFSGRPFVHASLTSLTGELVVVSHGDGQQPTLKASVKSKSMNCTHRDVAWWQLYNHLDLWICAAAIVPVAIGHYALTIVP